VAGHQKANYARYGGKRAYLGPNSSIAMMLAEMGVFAAPAKRATIPIAENIVALNPKTLAKTCPADAPMKNIGVIIPPLPPKLSVIAVNSIFRRNAPL